MAKVTYLNRSSYGQHVVMVTTPTAQADNSWWRDAALSKAWRIEHVKQTTRAGIKVDYVRATRRCSNGAQAARRMKSVAKAVTRAEHRALKANQSTTEGN